MVVLVRLTHITTGVQTCGNIDLKDDMEGSECRNPSLGLATKEKGSQRHGPRKE